MTTMVKEIRRRKVARPIAFDPDVLFEVDKRAQELGVSRSAFVNRILFSYLSRDWGGEVRPKGARRAA